MSNIETNIADAIIQKPIRLKLNKKEYEIHPLTLGKIQVINRYLALLNLEKIKDDPFDVIYSLCETRKADICKIIAICTFNDRWNLRNDAKIENRAKLFAKEETDNIATCVMLILSMDSIEQYVTHFKLDVEREDKLAIQRVRDSKNSKTFGGHSVWGAILDTACSKYGWTIDYILWDISYINLQMMLQDAINTVYLTDEDIKSLGVLPSEYADDPENADKILSNFSHIL